MICAALAVALSGCVSTRPRLSQIAAVQPVIEQAAGRYRKEYIWVPGDQIEIVVRRVPEASRTVIVRPDGFITLPLINDVKAAGLTPAELRDDVTKRFAERLTDPEVTVIAIQVPPPVVYVIGDVNNNIAVPLRSAATAIEAVTYAGGFRRSARPEDTVIVRLADDGQIQALPLTDNPGGQPGPVMGLRNMLLRPDDIVYVPEGRRSQVSRFLDDLVNRPLQTVTGALGVYFNFRLIRVINNQ